MSPSNQAELETGFDVVLAVLAVVVAVVLQDP